jgi:hypothetical protein
MSTKSQIAVPFNDNTPIVDQPPTKEQIKHFLAETGMDSSELPNKPFFKKEEKKTPNYLIGQCESVNDGKECWVDNTLDDCWEWGGVQTIARHRCQKCKIIKNPKWTLG